MSSFANAVRSVHVQTIHYLGRPHVAIPRRPVGGAAAWVAADHRDEARWTHALAAEEIAEAERALRTSAAIELRRLRAEDFPLPRLAPHVAAWRRELTSGRGFLRIRGVPTDRWSPDEVERFYWALGKHLGIPGAQNADGHLLGHVRDERLDADGRVRQYKTREAINYHCDAADVVGLLCLRPAKEGGRSRIASSVTVFDRLLGERPDLIPALFEPTHVDTRGDGGVDSFCVRPCAFHAGRLRTFYHGEYFRTVTRYPGIPPLSEAKAALLDRYDALAASDELHLEMELAPGDIQLISNHTIVHSRTGYVDHEDLAARRHLLRLWLSIEEPASWTERALRARAVTEVTARFVSRKLAARRSTA
ncbi:MAG: TauD/TfdA family dioxygenase [Sandaracinaceae bacterium]|nr:TauD/TfdA family dioxygenase [Sandaracinaceae bacterium]